jgi:hypothetical protein
MRASDLPLCLTQSIRETMPDREATAGCTLTVRRCSREANDGENTRATHKVAGSSPRPSKVRGSGPASSAPRAPVHAESGASSRTRTTQEMKRLDSERTGIESMLLRRPPPRRLEVAAEALKPPANGFNAVSGLHSDFKNATRSAFSRAVKPM